VLNNSFDLIHNVTLAQTLLSAVQVPSSEYSPSFPEDDDILITSRGGENEKRVISGKVSRYLF